MQKFTLKLCYNTKVSINNLLVVELCTSRSAARVCTLNFSAIVNVSRRVSSIPGHRRRRALYPPQRGRYAKGEMQRRNFVGLFRPVLVVESPFPPPSPSPSHSSFSSLLKHRFSVSPLPFSSFSLFPFAFLAPRRSRSFAQLSGQIDFS